MEIILPERLKGAGVLPFLSQLRDPQPGEEVILDFGRLRRITPVGLVTIAATVMRWRCENRRVHFRNLERCAVTSYLQRMDLLRVSGYKWEEAFERRDSKGRFVPVRLLDHHVDGMSQDVAACLAPGGEDYDHPMSGLYDLASYVLTETANNVRQHSGGIGYVAAQATRAEGMVRLALADNGMGILQTFRDAGFPWAKDVDDPEAIRKALEPRVSCKAGEPNEGVGLTLVSGLARLTQAWLMIVSGTGVLRIKPESDPVLSELPDGGHYQGTLVAMTFPEREAHDFARLLHNAKVESGLLRKHRAPIRFEP